MRKVLFFILISNVVFSQNNLAKKDNGYKILEADKNYGDFLWLHSDSMNKDFPVLVFLPNNYANSNKNFPVIYTLHGVNDSKLTEEGIRKLINPSVGYKEAANEFQCIIVTPLVGNKYYIDSPIFKNQKYATLIAIELVNLIDKKYKTIKDRKSRILQGFSMGGYGSISLLCRYPEIFSVALSRGGALEQKHLIDNLQWDDASIELLGDYFQNQKEYHLHSTTNLLNKIKDRTDVAIVMEIGREDYLYQGNKKVETKLKTTKIPYIFAEYPGGHEWSKEALYSMLTHLQYFVKTYDK
ncbi:MAG: hypothetical protein EAZ27_10075 [Cytophagales bacterium]|nr:MAG: hypothetical protein EAZ27_10075 [Cytophagales bacterium]